MIIEITMGDTNDDFDVIAVEDTHPEPADTYIATSAPRKQQTTDESYTQLLDRIDDDHDTGAYLHRDFGSALWDTLARLFCARLHPTRPRFS